MSSGELTEPVTAHPGMRALPGRAGLRDTPRRMVDTYVGMLTAERHNFTTFPHDAGYDELVHGLVRDDGRTRDEFLNLTGGR